MYILINISLQLCMCYKHITCLPSVQRSITNSSNTHTGAMERHILIYLEDSEHLLQVNETVTNTFKNVAVSAHMCAISTLKAFISA